MTLKSSIDIETRLYKIVNVSDITSKIDGEVYKGKKPLNSVLQDIVIKVLTNINTGAVVQLLTVHISCYCKKQDQGMHNDKKLKEITDAVLAKLTAYAETTEYFNFDIVWPGTVMDVPEQPEISASVIRLDCRIEN